MGIENIEELTGNEPAQPSPPVPAPSTEPATDPKLPEIPSDVPPAPEPTEQPSDPHTTPLDDIEDAQHLAEDDPRRQEVEQFKQGEAPEAA
jgi:hypothetical protein